MKTELPTEFFAITTLLMYVRFQIRFQTRRDKKELKSDLDRQNSHGRSEDLHNNNNKKK